MTFSFFQNRKAKQAQIDSDVDYLIAQAGALPSEVIDKLKRWLTIPQNNDDNEFIDMTITQNTILEERDDYVQDLNDELNFDEEVEE